MAAAFGAPGLGILLANSYSAGGARDISRRRSEASAPETPRQNHAPWMGAGLGLVLLRILVRRPCRDANNLLQSVPVVALRSTTG